MANFSIDNFQTEVRTRGLARPNRFEISFPVPKGLLNSSERADPRVISLFCESANLPSKTIGVKQQRIYGPSYPRPFSAEYGGEGITLTFLVDRDMDVKGFFDSWMNIIVDPFQYFIHYPDNYTVPILIQQLDENDDPTYSVTLEDAFPRSLALMELNNTAQNSVHKLNVTFVYRRWFAYHRLPNGLKYPEVWEQSTKSPSNPLQNLIIVDEPNRDQSASVRATAPIVPNSISDNRNTTSALNTLPKEFIDANTNVVEEDEEEEDEEDVSVSESLPDQYIEANTD
jgi:hypothetical protein